MAQTGDRFDMPDGSIYEVTAAAADSGGEFVGMDFTLPVGSVAPPPHVYPTPEESFEVIEGALDLMVDGQWRTLHIGESASVAPVRTATCIPSGTVAERQFASATFTAPRSDSRTTSNTSIG